jgi:hypothetical protein
MEIIWKILELNSQPNTGLVKLVKFEISFTLGEFTEVHTGHVPLMGSVSSPDFIPYDELTEDVVVEWVKSRLGENRVNGITRRFTAMLERKAKAEEKNIKKSSKKSLPWV